VTRRRPPPADPGTAGGYHRAVTDSVLLVLPDRDDAERIAAQLRDAGYLPALVHRDMLLGEDDAEDVDWVVELTTGPGGTPVGDTLATLRELADSHDGFVTS
jgi:putative hydrolase of the HAD superfamily